jgi:tetrapyrrole methylase family protein/MazG family protein
MQNDNPVDNPAFPDTFKGVQKLVERLTGASGCPWDKTQTMNTLIPMLVEECYELVEAIESNDVEEIIEEIGDVLFHMAFQMNIGVKKGFFKDKDIFASTTEKYIRRHPHVFGDKQINSMKELTETWEEIKKNEKEDRKSALDGIPKSMPSLTHSYSLQRRAAKTGFDWECEEDIRAKVIEEFDELANTHTEEEKIEEFGDILFSLVNAGRRMGIDPEQSLRNSNRKFENRFRAMEKISSSRGSEFKILTIEEKDSLWEEVKKEHLYEP